MLDKSGKVVHDENTYNSYIISELYTFTNISWYINADSMRIDGWTNHPCLQ